MASSADMPTSGWAQPIAMALVEGLEERRDGQRARAMAAYMKDHFPFLGVPSRPRRSAMRQAIAGCVDPTEAELLDLVDWCWARREREYQYVGADLLAKWSGVIGPALLPHLRRYIATKSWWDTVDALASHVVGELARRDAGVAAAMNGWIDDPDLWIARTAILHQLRWKTDTDADKLFRYCTRRADHPDFFIRKAIGWALRQYARIDPDAVAAYVASTPTLSPLSRREALKHLG